MRKGWSYGIREKLKTASAIAQAIRNAKRRQKRAEAAANTANKKAAQKARQRAKEETRQIKRATRALEAQRRAERAKAETVAASDRRKAKFYDRQREALNYMAELKLQGFEFSPELEQAVKSANVPSGNLTPEGLKKRTELFNRNRLRFSARKMVDISVNTKTGDVLHFKGEEEAVRRRLYNETIANFKRVEANKRLWVLNHLTPVEAVANFAQMGLMAALEEDETFLPIQTPEYRKAITQVIRARKKAKSVSEFLKLIPNVVKKSMKNLDLETLAYQRGVSDYNDAVAVREAMDQQAAEAGAETADVDADWFRGFIDHMNESQLMQLLWDEVKSNNLVSEFAAASENCEAIDGVHIMRERHLKIAQLFEDDLTEGNYYNQAMDELEAFIDEYLTRV